MHISLYFYNAVFSASRRYIYIKKKYKNTCNVTCFNSFDNESPNISISIIFKISTVNVIK